METGREKRPKARGNTGLGNVRWERGREEAWPLPAGTGHGTELPPDPLSLKCLWDSQGKPPLRTGMLAWAQDREELRWPQQPHIANDGHINHSWGLAMSQALGHCFSSERHLIPRHLCDALHLNTLHLCSFCLVSTPSLPLLDFSWLLNTQFLLNSSKKSSWLQAIPAEGPFSFWPGLDCDDSKHRRLRERYEALTCQDPKAQIKAPESDYMGKESGCFSRWTTVPPQARFLKAPGLSFLIHKMGTIAAS